MSIDFRYQFLVLISIMEKNKTLNFSFLFNITKSLNYTRIELFRKNYREIHGNQRIPNFLGIFTVVTVKITVNYCKNYRDFQ